MKSNRKTNLFFFLFFLLIEVLIALFIHDTFIRPYVGDMLVVVVIYFFLRIFIPQEVKLLPLYVFLFAAGVEILQYFQLVDRLGVQNNRVLRIIIGSTFDLNDIVCYGIGTILIVAVGSVRKKYEK